MTRTPPTKFRLNLTYSFGANVVSRFSWWPPIPERNDCSNSESLCRSNAFHHFFSSIRLTVWEEMLFEGFQDGRRGGHLGYRNGRIFAILNLYVALMPAIVSAQSDMVSEDMSFENFQDGCRGGHLGCRNGTILAILYITPMPPIKFPLNPTNDLGEDVVWRISIWPPRPFWIS